jgi:putative ABC transport system permease protein
MKFLPLLWSGIWRKPGRAVLAAVQIIVAFALFGLLQGFSTGIKHTLAEIDADVLSVHSRGSFSDLPLAHYAHIKQVPGVKLVSYSNYVGARYQQPTQQLLIIIAEPHDWADMTHNVVIAPAYVEALAKTRTGTIVGMALARKYGWKIGQRISLQTDVAQKNGSKDWAFDIVGFLEHKDPAARNDSTMILINFSYYDEARARDNGMVQQYMVRVADPKRAAAVADAIDNQFSNSAYETRTESWREIAQAQFRSLGDLDFTVHAITAAVLFSLFFSIGASLMQNVRERTPELAVLKTVGFTDGAVVALLVAEATLLCLVSAALGLGLARLLYWSAHRLNLMGGKLDIPASVLAAGAALAVFLALISAMLPAWRAMRLQVVEALAGR